MNAFLCAIPIVMNFFACVPPPLATGYVEGEFVLVAPVETARIVTLSVTRGERVKAGATLAGLEAEDARIAVAQAQAVAAEAQSRLADLKEGRRPAEISVLQAAVDQAIAQLDNLRHGARPEELAVLQAAVDQSKAQLANLEQGARPDEIAVLQAAVDQARAELANLEQGARAEEIAVLQAQVQIALATQGEATRALARVTDLARRGVSTQAQLDDAGAAMQKADAAVEQAKANLAAARLPARSDLIVAASARVRQAQANLAVAKLPARGGQIEAARAAVAQAEANLAVAQLPARADQIRAAQAAVDQAQANLAVGRMAARDDQIKAAQAAVEQAGEAARTADWRLSQRVITAPSDGVVFDIIRNPGEIAGPAAPVLSFLPDGAVKLRVYVPQASRSQVEAGTLLAVACDGCPTGMTARVAYVSPDPEFTPPVIYSIDSRQKLVFLVEAEPLGAATALRPGQIVEVNLAGDARQ